MLFGIGLAVFNPENSRLQIDLFALLRASAGLGVTTSLTFKFVLIRRHGAAPFLLAIGFSGLALGTAGLRATGIKNRAQAAAKYIIFTGAAILPSSFPLLSFVARYTPASNVSLALLIDTVLNPIGAWQGTSENQTTMTFDEDLIVVSSLAFYILFIQKRK